MADDVTYTLQDGLATICLNRPERLNALTAHLFRTIDEHIDRIDWSAVGCLLLTGAGRSFCAGHDLDDLASGAEGGSIERYENGVIERLASLPIPIVAAIRGHCYTGGLELALAADIIIASESARFADTHAKWDLVPIWGLTQRLPRRVGLAKAKEMMFASRTYSGKEAQAMGLADISVSDDLFEQEVSRLCSDILANSRRSNRAVKSLLADTDGLPLRAGIAWELHHSPGHGPDMGQLIAAARPRK